MQYLVGLQYILDMGAKRKSPKLDNIFLDCGCTTKEEVEKLGVHVGCVVTYKDEFMILNDNILCR